ncbi:transcription initiation factor IIB family protein [Candidatus Woesearchaeota archaeon]|jgi:transcription initiation factor TFIIB|nr:transcription initiation factor IIB family protein [Candidatus Woesearchaeota archaeon]MBT5272934.1 transcription initiation factor IIB family protein [Candidatus Woesearchaeota archaeon]MBT6041400.1 transcription initiation factor IIB family protein [Candidatus Woesearchaeota archaeon]MBT6337283.1 transcription initiation factor IIB family protein [Candidatus Woesearchaeota archaeon]MBT7927160.1 transcription initiation factor IIB family protein [Candidatus Woesearchaeota archaeon]
MMPTNCPDCGSIKISCMHNSHELICVDCGLVVEEGLFESHTHNIDRATPSIPQLATAGTSHMQGNIVRNSWLMNTRQKNLINAGKRIDQLTSKFKLPKSVVTEANLIYKWAVEKDLTIGRDNASFIYASVYTACAMHGIPKTPLELTAYTNISQKKLLRAYSLIKQKLGIQVNNIDPADLVPRFGSILGLKPTTVTKAMSIIHQLKGNVIISGKHPKTIVASAIYLATQMNNDYKPQREIANATGVIEVTLRKRSKEIKEVIRIT